MTTCESPIGSTEQEALDQLSPEEMEVVKKPTFTQLDPLRTDAKIPKGVQARLRQISKLKADGKWAPKKKIVKEGVHVAGPSWDPTIIGPNPKSAVLRSISDDRVSKAGGGQKVLSHAPDLDVPLFVDRGADQQAETQFGLTWWLLTSEGRTMLRLRAERYLKTGWASVVLLLMALTWRSAKTAVSADQSIALRTRWGSDGGGPLKLSVWSKFLHRPPTSAKLLPKFVNNWWDFGLAVRRRVSGLFDMKRHPRVGSWRRLLSMYWRRHFPAPRQEVHPSGWGQFRGKSGAYEAAGPTLKAGTVGGFSLQDFLDVGSTPAAWLAFSQYMGQRFPTVERLDRMLTDLGLPRPQWYGELPSLIGKVLIPMVRMKDPGDVSEMVEGLRRFPPWVAEYLDIEKKWNRMEAGKRQRVYLRNLMMDAVFESAVARRPLSRLSLQNTNLDVEIRRASGQYETPVWAEYASTLPKEELLAFLGEMRTLGFPENEIALHEIYVGGMKEE